MILSILRSFVGTRRRNRQSSVTRRHSVEIGCHPAGAISNPENTNAGLTVQPTKVQAPRLRALCQTLEGTMICGFSPPARSGPRIDDETVPAEAD